MKRNVVNKPNLKKCDICNKEISLYSFSSHLKWSHKTTSEEYSKIYGEFRKQKSITNARIIKKIKCGLCNEEYASVGFFVHLRDTHNISVDDYVKNFGEYRPSKLREKEYASRLLTTRDEDKQRCLICNQEFASGKLLGGHIKKIHNLSKKVYIREYVFKNIHPVCKCGCGKKVKILNYHPYKVDYISGHNSAGENNPMYGKSHNKLSIKKMSEEAVYRTNNSSIKTIDTEPELLFESLLNKFNIKYAHPHIISSENRSISVDFYLYEYDLCVEIDGTYWHPDKLTNLNFKLLSSVISDKQKNSVIKNLYRLRSDILEVIRDESTDEKTFIENIKKYNKINNLSLDYYDVIIDKDYFENCINIKGKDYVESFIWLLKKFVRNFQEEFPYPTLHENIDIIKNTINNYDFLKIYDADSKTFSNNISTIGHNYLKHHFKSYWKSKFNGNKSPQEAWKDDKIINDVIKYRVGCNESNEIFDFSLHQLVRGFSARRITISFFKPLLAGAIYKHYLGDKNAPVVLDPCCGFGGRLLGFKSVYPSGIYIGCEPNKETYEELLTLIKNAGFENVKIYNCKFEDFIDENYNYDLVFTSIPYYDVEIYSNNIKYKSFYEWKNTFIKSIEKYNGRNCYINVSKDLGKKLNWSNIDTYISSNRSHFDKNSESKVEIIVKIL